MPLLHPSPTHLPTETADPIPVPNDSDLSDSLVPQQTLQSAAVSTVSFDGLLNEPLLLREDLKEGCGGRLWPAGMLLAKHLLRHHRSDLVDKSMSVVLFITILDRSLLCSPDVITDTYSSLE